MSSAMFLLLALAFPAVLLVLMLTMERVEAPLRDEALGERVAQALDDVRADDVESLVSEDLAPAVDRYWRRRALRNRWLARRLAKSS
ncbi:MAG TPA: hypothetical protein VFT62_02280 [Mycobacteriales bacterium]|nr:hypothetical protein [Mycobacteriales bacterium]